MAHLRWAGQKTIDSESRAKEKFDRGLDKKWREFTQQFEERTYQAILRQAQNLKVSVPDEYSRRAAANLRAQLFGETSPTAEEWQTLRRDFEHVLSSQLTQAAQQYAVDQATSSQIGASVTAELNSSFWSESKPNMESTSITQ